MNDSFTLGFFFELAALEYLVLVPGIPYEPLHSAKVLTERAQEHISTAYVPDAWVDALTRLMGLCCLPWTLKV